MSQPYERKGILAVAVCYVAWGILPVYWNLLSQVNSLYILCARILWSLVFCVVYLTIRKEWKEIRAIFADKKQVLRCLGAGMVICVNWGSYIWAVNHGRILDSSFGYFINPMISILLGACLFREKLSKIQWFACGLAFAGVLWSICLAGTVPVLAFIIGGSFSCYGVIKKKLTLKSEHSLFMETLLTAPFALAVSIFLESRGLGAAGVLEGPAYLLFPLAGVITAVPLLLFAYGVKKIPYYLTGMLMYLNPTMQFLVGIILYQKHIESREWVSFGFIWAGVLVMILGEGLFAHRHTLQAEARG